jgi:hypothetical protein
MPSGEGACKSYGKNVLGVRGSGREVFSEFEALKYGCELSMKR